jgi:LysM repeat protein
MAVDLRRSNTTRCREWLQSTLLSLEGAGVLEATLERSPPHYHIAIFPQPYARYVAALTGTPASEVRAAASVSPPVSPRGQDEVTKVAIAEDGSRVTINHRVARGESLWTIARLYGVTESSLRAANGLSGSVILAGQALVVPTAARPTGDVLRYTVQRGDSLWVIATRVGTTVDEIRRANGIGSSRIYAGQVLDVPVSR